MTWTYLSKWTRRSTGFNSAGNFHTSQTMAREATESLENSMLIGHPTDQT